LDELDIYRNKKIQNLNKFTIIINKKLEDVLIEYSSYIEKYKPLLNFTDSLYYIQDLTVQNFEQYPNNYIIGFGTAHVLVSDGPLIIDNKEFGQVKSIKFRDSVYMKMEVFGNVKPYVHPVFFQKLLDYNSVIINNNDNTALLLSKQNSVNLGATLYVSFVIYKVDYNPNMLIDIPTFCSGKNVVSKIIGIPPYQEIPYMDTSKIYNIKINDKLFTKIRTAFYSYKNSNKGVINKVLFANELLLKTIEIPTEDIPLIIKVLIKQDNDLNKKLNED
jgi:hypothetical protein